MKKINILIVHILVSCALILSVTSVVYALDTPDGSYTLLSPIPGTYDASTCTAGTGCKTTLSTYLPGVFNFAISFAGLLAFIMISYGGFLYMTSDSISGTSKGKEYIESAIYGLVFVIGAYVILNTINPRLLEFNLSLPTPKTVEDKIVVEPGVIGTGSYTNNGKALPGYTLSDEQVKMNNNMVKDLALQTGDKLSVNAGPCATGGTTGCTNLVGLPANAYTGIKNLTNACNCNLVITGGTEGGHVTHGPGQPVMDIAERNSTDMNKFVTQYGGTPVQTKNGPVYTVNQTINGQAVNATILYEGPGQEGSSGAHWHVVFK